MSDSCTSLEPRRGASIVLVLVVLVIFSSLGVGLLTQGERARVEAAKQRQSMQAFWAAEGGIQRTLARLAVDPGFRALPAPVLGTLGGVGYEVLSSTANGLEFELVAEAVTFAWQRTVRVEVALPAEGTFVRDEFSTQAYDNNDGDAAWVSDWVEAQDDGAPLTGKVSVDPAGFLRVHNRGGGPTPSIARPVNLIGTATAEVRFDVLGFGASFADRLAVNVSIDEGVNWVTVDQIDTQFTTTKSYMLEDYISLNAVILLSFEVVSGLTSATTSVGLDNLKIEYPEGLGSPVILAWEEL